MGPRIRGQRLNPTGKSPLELELQRIVVRSTGICYQLSLINRLVGKAANLCRLNKTSSGGSHVRGRDRLLLSQGLFDGNIPLQRVRQSEIRVKRNEKPWAAGALRQDRHGRGICERKIAR